MEPSAIDNIKKHLQLIHKKKHIAIFTAILIITVFILGSYSIPKKYEAKSTLLIEHNVIENLFKGIAITPSMEDRIKVLRDIILSRSLVLKVLHKLGLDSEVKNDKELEEMISASQQKTKIKVKKKNLYIVSYRSEHPVIARDYINNLIKMYVEENISAKKEEASEALRFLTKQVAFFKEKIDRTGNAIIKFRQEQGIYMVVGERSIVREITNYMDRIKEMGIKRNELIATRDNLKRQLESENPFMVTALTDGFLDRKDKMIESLENRLKQLLITYTEDYPEVIKIKDEIAALKKPNFSIEYTGSWTESETGAVNPIYQQIKQKVIELGADISALNAKEKKLNDLMKDKEKQLRYIPEGKKKLADLEKDRDTYISTYEKLLERLGQAEVSEQMEAGNKTMRFRIIEPAVLPTIPVSTNRKMLILAGIMFGLLGGFGIVYSLDGLDKSVKSIDDIKTLGLPVLATIPKIQSAEDLIKIRKKDTLLYSFAGVYMLCILGLFTLEYMGLTFVDDFVQQHLVTIKDTIRGIF